jgi:germination protein M
MTRRLLALAALPLLLGGCGSTTGSTTSTAEQPMSVVAYFLRDGKVAPVRVEVPRTRAVGTAALNALLAGPPADLDTAVPDGTRLESLTIDAGVAHPVFSADLGRAAQAQVVYTLTRFPTVTGVALPGAGEPLTRADLEDETPRILVDSPLPGDRVASPIRVTGTSNDFEATFQLELRQGDATLARRFVTATSGNGERGTFDASLPYDGSGAATLVAYEQNAGEGPPRLGRVEIPLDLG